MFEQAAVRASPSVKKTVKGALMEVEEAVMKQEIFAQSSNWLPWKPWKSDICAQSQWVPKLMSQ